MLRSMGTIGEAARAAPVLTSFEHQRSAATRPAAAPAPPATTP